MITLTEENYLKTIYHLSNNGLATANTNAIAKMMETKASSVTDMLKKLSEKQYTNYKKYQGVSLTNLGKQLAVNIIRKHRLWEVFLVNHFNFSWDEVHEVAEQLEHIKSQKLIDELDAFLNFPTIDPHGDPIPNKDGSISKINKISLSEAKTNTTYTCVGMNDSSKMFLNYLDKLKIKLGSRIKVISIEPYDNSLTIEIENKKTIISYDVSKNLYMSSN